MKRDAVFDYMKGVGILAVVTGHCYPNTIVSHVIYSFHMPLFFIISGYFLNVDKPIVSSVIHDMKRLLLPIAFTITSIVLYKLMIGENLIGGGNMGAFSIGPMWFLLALFWARLILRLITFVLRHITTHLDSWLLAGSVIVSALVNYFHSLLPYWHICLMLGVSALQFVTLGWVLRREGCSILLEILFVISWAFALTFGNLNMVHYEYGCYPLDVIGSVGGTFVIYYFCKFLDYLNCHNLKPIHWICTALGWCGVHSLLILCIHTFDLKSPHFMNKLLK